VRRYYATRVAEIIDLFDAVFTGAETYEMVVMGDSDDLADMLDYPLADPVKNKASLGGAGGSFYLFSWTYDDTDLDGQTADDMLQEMLDYWQYILYKRVNLSAAVVYARGVLAYYCYEGGQHFYGSNFDDARWAQMLALPRWGDFQQHMYANIHWYLNGLGFYRVLLAHYEGSKGHQAGVYFGIRETNLACTSPDTPTWDALVAFNASLEQPDWTD